MFKKSLSFILISSPLLLVCDFRPEHKVIEYQEEVKLSDGSFIWVDIKRHYGWSGWAPGGGSGAYMPGIVEISWDTGFPNVGRQSVFFDGENAFEFIDKVENLWYVEGGKTRCNTNNIIGGVYNESNICIQGLGTRLNHSAYLYVVGDRGFLKNRSLDELSPKTTYNILDVRQLRDIGDPPIEFNGQRISWQQKLNLQSSRKGYGNIFGKSVKALP